MPLPQTSCQNLAATINHDLGGRAYHGPNWNFRRALCCVSLGHYGPKAQGSHPHTPGTKVLVCGVGPYGAIYQGHNKRANHRNGALYLNLIL